MKPTAQIPVRFDPEFVREVNEKAIALKISRQELIRRALVDYMPRAEPAPKTEPPKPAERVERPTEQIEPLSAAERTELFRRATQRH